jgi:hypothetical protein
MPCGTGIADAVQAVEARLATGFPAEAVAVKSYTKADGQFLAARSEVRYAHCGPASE